MILLHFGIAIGGVVWAGGSAPRVAGPPVESAPLPTAGGSRVVKHFDFDERPLGNLDSVPMLWIRRDAAGFPPFALGGFDSQIGCQAAPSFYLGLNGRSCAYDYSGLDIVIEPDSHYRVAARIRPDRLRSARAYLSAFLLDANGQRIEGSEIKSPLIGGEADSEWQPVTLDIPGDLDGAYAIGLTAWAVQREVWWDGPEKPRHIDHKDVTGGAWFDDVLVYRLPNVVLTTSAAERGNLFSASETPVLLVKVGDANRHELVARLTVHDAAGGEIYSEPIEVTRDAGPPLHRRAVPNLPPGVYTAQLEVQMSPGTLVHRQVVFAKSTAAPGPRERQQNRYGVILEPDSAMGWKAASALVSALGIRYVKIELERGHFDAPAQRQERHQNLLSELRAANVSVTGTLVNSGPPPPGTAPAAGKSSVVDLLSTSAETWRPFLAQTVTRYESLLDYWQIGRDGDTAVAGDPRLDTVLAALRGEMAKLTLRPVMVAPASAHHEPQNGTADILSVSLPVDIQPGDLPHYLDTSFGGLGYREVWAVIETAPAERYRRLPYLADAAKRLIYAHHSSATRLFVRQPWRVRSTEGPGGVEPAELYLVYRTVIDMLDDADFAGPVDLGEGVTAFLFDRHEQATLVVWDDSAPLQGTEHELYAYGARQSTDLWGNRTTVEATDGSQRVTLSPLPVFLEGGQSWLVAFRQGMRFDPELLPSESSFHEQALVLTNPRNDPMSGSIRLQAPDGWQIRPARFNFAVQPGATVSRPIRIQPAPREPAGRKTVSAEVTLDAEQMYRFEVQLPLKLDLVDMEVWVDVALDASTLIIRHGVTNRSKDVVTLESFADAPGRKRQNLHIIGLQPRQTVIKSHYFRDAQSLSGKQVRVGLKQVKGPRAHNLSVSVP